MSFLFAVLSLINLGLLIDCYYLEPNRFKELVTMKIKAYEDSLPPEKFIYSKTRCPHCNKNME